MKIGDLLLGDCLPAYALRPKAAFGRRAALRALAGEPAEVRFLHVGGVNWRLVN